MSVMDESGYRGKKIKNLWCSRLVGYLNSVLRAIPATVVMVYIFTVLHKPTKKDRGAFLHCKTMSPVISVISANHLKRDQVMTKTKVYRHQDKTLRVRDQDQSRARPSQNQATQNTQAVECD